MSLWVVLAAAAPSGLAAQEPATRAEELARQRKAKAQELAPPETSRLERTLLALESGRLFERLLSPPEGFYPKLGNLTPGSGFAIGPAYRRPGVLTEEVHVSAFAAASLDKYWMLDARLRAPDLAGGRLFAEAYGRRYDFPEEDFFGLGPGSRREDHATYGLRSFEAGGGGGVRLAPWLSLGGAIDYLAPDVSVRGAPGPAFSRTPTPGFTPAAAAPDFLRTTVTAEFNTREPRGNPREGARYALSYQRFADLDSDALGFHRVEADLQQYISIYRNRRVLALRALASVSDADAGAEVPFYFQRTLGGPDDLRGFRRFRFRDRNLLLFQAEYRWEIFTAVDGALFYDAGKVASRAEDLDFADLESDYGIGFRFGTRNGVFLRIEGAFGSSGGAHFIWRFGHVF